MISISDGKDIHFRKAKFDPSKPSNCPRPCEKICPTFAIDNSGIKESKCYGCGRCIKSCPLNLISDFEYNLSKDDLPSTLQKTNPDAVEIHTEIDRKDSFADLISILKSSETKLEKISVSCGLNQSPTDHKDPDDLLKALWERYEILNDLNIPIIWQLDGRPMSGDLSPTTGKDSVKLFKIIGSHLPPGLIQLAGGTNEKTHEFLNKNNFPDGIAFGSSARRISYRLLNLLAIIIKDYRISKKMALAIKRHKSY